MYSRVTHLAGRKKKEKKKGIPFLPTSSRCVFQNESLTGPSKTSLPSVASNLLGCSLARTDDPVCVRTAVVSNQSASGEELVAIAVPCGYNLFKRQRRRIFSMENLFLFFSRLALAEV